MPKVDVKSIESIKFDEYTVKIDPKETEKRIQDIAKNQPNFKDAPDQVKAAEKDLVIFDYTATVDDKSFKLGGLRRIVYPNQGGIQHILPLLI